MKLQRMTWGLLIVALLLGGGVYFYEKYGKPKAEEIQVEGKKIFDFEAEDIKELTIKTQPTILQFVRTEDKTKPWQMKQPEEAVANEAVVSFLISLLVDGQSDRTFKIPAEQRQDYGLDQPLATIIIQLNKGETHQLILGKPDFNGQFIYATIDPSSQPQQELSISLVPQNFQFAIERSLEEWKQREEVIKNQ